MEVKNLSITTKKNKQLIKDITIQANTGELLAILGPNGCGKTLLLDYIVDEFQSDLNYSGSKTIFDSAKVKYVSQDLSLNVFFTVKNYISHYLDLNYGKIEESRKNDIIN